MDNRTTIFQYQKTMKNPSSGKKLPRLKRVSANELPSFQLTQRDREIVEEVYRCRALSTPQIDALFFLSPYDTGKHGRVSSRCLHRLKLLFHTGYLRRVEQAQTLSDGRKPLVYFLDRHGAQYLADLDKCKVEDLDWDRQEHEVSSLFLDHLLLSNDIRVSVILAARNHGYGLVDWQDERELRRVHQKEKEHITVTDEKGIKHKVALIPDGYFVLEIQRPGSGTPFQSHQFLEVDRSTSTIRVGEAGKRDWSRKVKAYINYANSDNYKKRYHTKSMRILTVTTSQKRLEHLKKATEEAKGKARFWFTTVDQITADTILTAPIWQVASRDGLVSLME